MNESPAEDQPTQETTSIEVPPSDAPSGGVLALPQLWRKRRWLWIGLSAALVLLLGLGAFAMKWWSDWGAPGMIPPSGGLYFVRRVELPVPLFRQNDPRWGDDPLGPTEDTLGSAGCAVSSAAMVLAYHGIDTDPQRLNAFVTERDGYTPQGWIYWEKAAELAPERVRHVYEDLPSYRLIDTNLARGNPVIVRLRMPTGTTHFVVVAGKDGFEYLTRDPGRGGAKGLYPLRDLGSKIEALRFYERLDGPVPESQGEPAEPEGSVAAAAQAASTVE